MAAAGPASASRSQRSQSASWNSRSSKPPSRRTTSVRARTFDPPAQISFQRSRRSASCSAGGGARAWRKRRRSSTHAAAVYANAARPADAASICARSFRGAQRSSSSRNAIQAPRPAAIPALRAWATPRGSSCRMRRRRGSSRAASSDEVPSSEPSSITITSCSTPSCPSADGSADVESRRQRFRVGITTVTSGCIRRSYETPPPVLSIPG